MKKALLFLALSLVLVFTLSVAFADEENLVTDSVQLIEPLGEVETELIDGAESNEEAISIEPTDEVVPTENPEDVSNDVTPTIITADDAGTTSTSGSVMGAIIAIVIVVAIIAVVALLQK